MRKGLVCFIGLLASLLWPAVVLAQQATPTSVPGTVIVEWTTDSEVNQAGFNLYRSESPEGPYVKLNDTLIPASPDPLTGGSYSFTDTTARAGVKYYYKLEDVELDGSTTVHGPTEVVAQAAMSSQGLLPWGYALGALATGVVAGTGLFLVARRRASSVPPARSIGPDRGEKR